MGWLSRFRKWLHQYDGQLIEKSYKYPQSDKRNPFEDRLDPAKEIKLPNKPS